MTITSCRDVAKTSVCVLRKRNINRSQQKPTECGPIVMFLE